MSVIEPEKKKPGQDIFTEDDLREKRYLWTARVFAIFAAVAFCANILMLLAIMGMLPLVRVESFLLHFKDKREQVIQVVPFSGNLINNTDISEAQIQQYVLVRNTVTADLNEMTELWSSDGPVRYMSTDAVFSEFVQKNIPVLNKLRDEGFTRDVFIRTITRVTVRGSRAYWQVDMRTRDMLPTKASPEETCWTVGLEVGYFYNTKIRYEDRLKNPLGFKVTQYSMQAKEKCD